MDFIIFLVFSIFEFMAIFSFMFSLYRLQTKHYWMELLIISMILSFFSYSLRGLFHTEAFTPAVLIVIMATLIWIVLRIPFFYVAILTIPTYIAYGLLQFGVMSTLDYFEIITFEQIFNQNASNQYGQIVQIITALITVIASWGVYKTGVGFSFVPTGNIKVKLNALNIVISIALLVAFVLFVFFDYLIKEKIQFIILASIFTILLGMLLLLVRKKDYE